MSLPLASIRKPRKTSGSSYKDILSATAETPRIRLLLSAIKEHDVAGVKALLPSRGRFNAYEAHMLDHASDFEMLKVWIRKAPRVFCIDPKWKLTATQARDLLSAAGRSVVLEFPKLALKRIEKEDPELSRRIAARADRANGFV